MTPEEVERTMQVLLAQQVQFAADLTTWREKSAAELASFAAWKEESTRRHEELRGIVGDVAIALKDAVGLVESLAERQAETDRQQRQTARQQRETARQLKETDNQVRETDRHLRETDRHVGELTRAVREIADSERDTRNRVTALEARDRRGGDNGPH